VVGFGEIGREGVRGVRGVEGVGGWRGGERETNMWGVTQSRIWAIARLSIGFRV